MLLLRGLFGFHSARPWRKFVKKMLLEQARLHPEFHEITMTCVTENRRAPLVFYIQHCMC